MKKIIAFLLLFLPICFLLKTNSFPDSIFKIDGIEKICVVTKDKIRTEEDIETLSYNYLFFDKDQKEEIKNIDADGYVFYLKNIGQEKLKNNLNLIILSEEKILDKKVVYGYTPLYNKTIIVGGKKVNTEIVTEKDSIIVGFPLILSGY